MVKFLEKYFVKNLSEKNSIKNEGSLEKNSQKNLFVRKILLDFFFHQREKVHHIHWEKNQEVKFIGKDFNGTLPDALKLYVIILKGIYQEGLHKSMMFQHGHLHHCRPPGRMYFLNTSKICP